VLRFENLIGRIHPEDRTRVIAEFARAEQAEGSFKDEFRVVIPGGGEQCVAALDIIERKRAEQDIKAALVEVQTLKERLEEENLYLKEEISEVKGFNEIIGESDVLK